MAGPKNGKPFNDASLLSAEDQEAIREKAAEVVAKERHDAAEKALLEQALAEERRKHDVGPRDEDLMTVQIDLPGYSDGLVINAKKYFHGSTYTVPVSLGRDMLSMMARAWEHENEIGGANRDAYQKPRQQVLRPGMA